MHLWLVSASLLLSMSAVSPSIERSEGASAPPSSGRASPALDPSLPLGSCSGGGQRVVPPARGASARYEGQLSGVVEPQEIVGEYCAGYVPEQPQLCFTSPRGGGNFSFHVTDGSGVDTVLVAKAMQRAEYFCDDDSGGGLLSRIDDFFPAGEYAIYVGTYSAGNTGRFELLVERW